MARKVKKIKSEDDANLLEEARASLDIDDIGSIKNFIECGGSVKEAFGDDLKVDEFGDRTLTIRLGKNKEGFPETIFIKEPNFDLVQTSLGDLNSSRKSYVQDGIVIDETVSKVGENINAGLLLICRSAEIDYAKMRKMRSAVILDMVQRFFTAFELNLQ